MLIFVPFNKRVIDEVLLLGKVKGMEVGITVEMKNQEGSLKLSLMECGFYLKDISITLDGGASWFYQGYEIFLNYLS